jgi:hypothetical protein
VVRREGTCPILPKMKVARADLVSEKLGNLDRVEVTPGIGVVM